MIRAESFHISQNRLVDELSDHLLNLRQEGYAFYLDETNTDSLQTNSNQCLIELSTR